jgi:hypothetical protein
MSGYMAIAHEEPPVKSAVIGRPLRREWAVIGPLDLQDAAGDTIWRRANTRKSRIADQGPTPRAVVFNAQRGVLPENHIRA